MILSVQGVIDIAAQDMLTNISLVTNQLYMDSFEINSQLNEVEAELDTIERFVNGTDWSDPAQEGDISSQKIRFATNQFLTQLLNTADQLDSCCAAICKYPGSVPHEVGETVPPMNEEKQ